MTVTAPVLRECGRAAQRPEALRQTGLTDLAIWSSLKERMPDDPKEGREVKAGEGSLLKALKLPRPVRGVK